MSKCFVIAPDSFKESLSAKEACLALASGVKKVFPDAEIMNVPMADGGEGTVDALIDALNGKKVEVEVTGPLGNEKVKAYFGYMEDTKTAVMEMAKASGIGLLAPEKRNPLLTSTYGTGEMMAAALDLGAEKIIIGIGGSVTNDGGAGMAQALGVKFFDEKGAELPLGGGALGDLATLDLKNLDSRLAKTQITVASDVTNPLVGPHGASHVFGPQKGATPEMVAQLDANLAHYAQVIKRNLGKDLANYPGAGAAGGLGAGLLAFTGAELKPGIEIVVEITGLAEKIKKADYVFTGEGGMDFQTKFGKAPYGVAKVAQSFQKPVFAFAGYIGKDVEVLYDEGMTAIFGILSKAQSLEEALATGAENLSRTSENVCRVLKLNA